MKKLVFAYATCKNEREAKAIGKKLVKEKLIVCANVIPRIKSFYFWKGKLQEDKEAVLICKLFKGKEKTVEKIIRKMHSYEVPFIGFIEFSKVNKAYINWAKNNK